MKYFFPFLNQRLKLKSSLLSHYLPRIFFFFENSKILGRSDDGKRRSILLFPTLSSFTPIYGNLTSQYFNLSFRGPYQQFSGFGVSPLNGQMQWCATVTVKGVDNGLESFHILKNKLQKWINIPLVVNKEVKASEKS